MAPKKPGWQRQTDGRTQTSRSWQASAPKQRAAGRARGEVSPRGPSLSPPEGGARHQHSDRRSRPGGAFPGQKEPRRARIPAGPLYSPSRTPDEGGGGCASRSPPPGGKQLTEGALGPRLLPSRAADEGGRQTSGRERALSRREREPNLSHRPPPTPGPARPRRSHPPPPLRRGKTLPSSPGEKRGRVGPSGALRGEAALLRALGRTEERGSNSPGKRLPRADRSGAGKEWAEREGAGDGRGRAAASRPRPKGAPPQKPRRSLERRRPATLGLTPTGQSGAHGRPSAKRGRLAPPYLSSAGHTCLPPGSSSGEPRPGPGRPSHSNSRAQRRSIVPGPGWEKSGGRDPPRSSPSRLFPAALPEEAGRAEEEGGGGRGVRSP